MKSFKQFLLEGSELKDYNSALQAKIDSAIEEIKHNAKELYGGDLDKAHEEYKKKSTFGPKVHDEIHKKLYEDAPANSTVGVAIPELPLGDEIAKRRKLNN